MTAVQTLEPTAIAVETVEGIRPARCCFRPILRDRRSRRSPRRGFRSGLQGACPRRADEYLRQGAWELAA
jgi:hypothetical protein